MSKLIRFGRYLLLGLLLCVGGCGIGSKLDDPLRIRYRQTVTFEGPQGQVQVSGVLEEVIRYSGPVPGYGPNIQSYRLGEALGAEVPGVGYVVQTMMYIPRSAETFQTVVSTACGIPKWNKASGESPSEWMKHLDERFVKTCFMPISESSLVMIYRGGLTPYNVTMYFPEHLSDKFQIVSISIERTSDDVEYGNIPDTLWKYPKGRPAVSVSPLPKTQYPIVIDRALFIDEATQ